MRRHIAHPMAIECHMSWGACICVPGRDMRVWNGCRGQSTCWGDRSGLRCTGNGLWGGLWAYKGRGSYRRWWRGYLVHQFLLEEALGLYMTKARAKVAFGAIRAPILRGLGRWGRWRGCRVCRRILGTFGWSCGRSECGGGRGQVRACMVHVAKRLDHRLLVKLVQDWNGVYNVVKGVWKRPDDGHC